MSLEKLRSYDKKFQVTTRANKNTVPASNYWNKTLQPQNQTKPKVGLLILLNKATKEGWLYVATVLDLFSRKISSGTKNKQIFGFLASYSIGCKIIGEFCRISTNATEP